MSPPWVREKFDDLRAVLDPGLADLGVRLSTLHAHRQERSFGIHVAGLPDGSVVITLVGWNPASAAWSMRVILPSRQGTARFTIKEATTEAASHSLLQRLRWWVADYRPASPGPISVADAIKAEEQATLGATHAVAARVRDRLATAIGRPLISSDDYEAALDRLGERLGNDPEILDHLHQAVCDLCLRASPLSGDVADLLADLLDCDPLWLLTGSCQDTP